MGSENFLHRLGWLGVTQPHPSTPPPAAPVGLGQKERPASEEKCDALGKLLFVVLGVIR